jgi:putative ABC transport system permease protein
VGHRITSIFRYFFRRESVETDLDRELRYHLDRQTELNERMGMSREDARRRAALAVGGVEPLKD